MFVSCSNKSVDSHSKIIHRFLYDGKIVLIWFNFNEFSLTHVSLNVTFLYPRKTSGFLTFSGGIEM